MVLLVAGSFRYLDLAVSCNCEPLTIPQQYNLLKKLEALPRLQGIRYLAPPSIMPLLQMIPRELDYLEIFPSSARPSRGHRGVDRWYGLRPKTPIKVNTLVLVDRSWGVASKTLNYYHNPQSMADMGRLDDGSSGESETPLHELFAAVADVKRLVLRMDLRPLAGRRRLPLGGDRFAADLGNCLSECSLASLEEIVFELAREDGYSLGPCSDKCHIVSQGTRD